MIATTAAWAGPEGTFDVVGKNPDDNGQYEGTVTVKRTGDTYSVVWDVAGTGAGLLLAWGVDAVLFAPAGGGRDDARLVTLQGRF